MSCEAAGVEPGEIFSVVQYHGLTERCWQLAGTTSTVIATGAARAWRWSGNGRSLSFGSWLIFVDGAQWCV